MARAPQTDRDLLLSLCASLTLADHMGDVAEYVYEVLARLGIQITGDDDWQIAVRKELHSRGVKTLYNTALR